MSDAIEKVNAFTTPTIGPGTDLLLLQHPYASIQLPAGTVEAGETPEQAVLREAYEETGLQPLTILEYLGAKQTSLPADLRLIHQPTRVYARPDATSFDWAYLRIGIQVNLLRKSAGFSQISYEEPDREPNPQYTTMQITGWVPDQALTNTSIRHFFLLDFKGSTPARWTVFSDNHNFKLFWVSLSDAPALISPYQAHWLAYLLESESLNPPSEHNRA
jgi:8-oxo-dGTP pyrophosphatase MutT (NUDIX family)